HYCVPELHFKELPLPPYSLHFALCILHTLSVFYKGKLSLARKSYQQKMASVTAMQTILASPVVRASTASRVSHLYPSTSVGVMRRNVRCMAEGDDGKAQDIPTAPKISTPPPQPTPTPAPKAAPKVSTKFSDILAFSGPAPERINGRLAMIGFVAAMAVELSKGQDVFSQISEGGVAWFVGTSVVLSIASLVPLFKGVSVESKSQGLMTSDAELLNGRFAMLGLVALAFTEFVKGGALV
ncbi:Early light-induced protein 1, chloroplastic, partial [Turnera subulata]